MKYTTKLKGELNLSEDDVIKFHPWVKPLLDEISERGWKHTILNIDAEALIELDLDNLTLNLHYHPPRIERGEENGSYEVSAGLGSEPPAILKILSVNSFDIAISTEHCWHAVEIDPFKSEVKRIYNVFWHGISEEDAPRNLAEAREVYELVKWLIDEKGFKLATKYAVEEYKELVDLFEKPYKFTLTLELTVGDEKKVPSWKELEDDLHEFFYERGLLCELKREGKDFLNLFKDPLP